MSNNKKYQFFVSSTFSDLIDARKKIIETILESYHFPVGMEMFGTDDSEEWKFIQDTIDVSDYYILILGHRYGSMSSEGIGFTEMEYDYAKSKNIPILTYIRDRNISTTPEERENDPIKIAKLNNFYLKATADKLCNFWSNIDDLATKVALSLPKVMARHPQIGWIRADNAVTPELTAELVRLNEENRKYRNDIALLKSAVNNFLPDLDFFINGEKELSLEFSQVPSELVVRMPRKLALEDVPENLKSLTNLDIIEKHLK